MKRKTINSYIFSEKQNVALVLNFCRFKLNLKNLSFPAEKLQRF